MSQLKNRQDAVRFSVASKVSQLSCSNDRPTSDEFFNLCADVIVKVVPMCRLKVQNRRKIALIAFRPYVVYAGSFPKIDWIRGLKFDLCAIWLVCLEAQHMSFLPRDAMLSRYMLSSCV